MSATLTYNGVTIDNVDLKTVDSQVVYDDAEQGRVYTKSTITVVGTIALASAGGDLAGDITTARKALSTPRANLVLTLGGNDLFNVTAPDDLQGPKPRDVEITEFVGSMFSMVKFVVEINQTECSGGSLGDIASHTYNVDHRYDERFLLTRTIRGRLVVRQNATDTNNPDALRGLITPGLPDGMRRKSMSFLVATDGLTLEYEIVDEELYLTPPKPAIKAQGTFSHRLTNMTKWMNAFEVEVQGPKTQPKVEMFRLAYQIAASRIDFGEELILEAQFTESLYDNTVRMQVITQVVALVQTTGDIADTVFPIKTNMFRDVPGENSTEVLGPYGSALVLAAKRAFFDPCTSTVSPPSETGGGSDTTPAPDVSIGTLPTSGEVSGSRYDRLKSTQQTAPYTLWEESFGFDQDNGVVVLPSSQQGVPAKVYQLHSPFFIVHHRGQATRERRTVEPPAPTINSRTVVKRRNVQFHAPDLMEDQRTFQYRAAWDYEIIEPLVEAAFVQIGDYTDLDANQGFALPLSEIEDGSSQRSVTLDDYRIAE